MDYNIEEIIQVIKKARQNKGLSQRALSAKAGLPQSHISKIEQGDVNIKLSTLIDLARALDLEIKLVPRKLVPAVNSITRKSSSENMASQNLHSVRNDVRQLEKAMQSMEPVIKAGKELEQFQRAIREIEKYRMPIQTLNDFKKVSDTIRALREGPNAINEIRKATKKIQSMRNMLAHSIPEVPSLPTPAYSLEDDDNA